MPRTYSVTFDGVAATAAQDFFEINAASDSPVELISMKLSQSSDAGDAEAEMLRVTITRGHATSGSGGSSFTAIPHDPGDTAFGGTCEINNTTQASTGTPVVVMADAWNVQAPYLWAPTPEEYIYIAGGSRAVVELPAAPADSLTISGTITFREYG